MPAPRSLAQSLQATALVNEAYLRLVDVRRVNWQNRTHFLAMSARIMRRVLVDAARARGADKRGGHAVRVSLSEASERRPDLGEDVIALNDALDALEREMFERRASWSCGSSPG